MSDKKNLINDIITILDKSANALKEIQILLSQVSTFLETTQNKKKELQTHMIFWEFLRMIAQSL